MLIDTARVYNDPSKLYDKQKKKIWKKIEHLQTILS